MHLLAPSLSCLVLFDLFINHLNLLCCLGHCRILSLRWCAAEDMLENFFIAAVKTSA